MKGRKISLSRRQEADTCVKDGNILFQGEKVMSVSELSLKGSHNLENSLFIVTAGNYWAWIAKSFGIFKEYRAFGT